MSSYEETNNFKSDFIRLDNSFSTLPETFYSKVQPQLLSNPYLVSFNENLAYELGILTDLVFSFVAIFIDIINSI